MMRTLDSRNQYVSDIVELGLIVLVLAATIPSFTFKGAFLLTGPLIGWIIYGGISSEKLSIFEYAKLLCAIFICARMVFEPSRIVFAMLFSAVVLSIGALVALRSGIHERWLLVKISMLVLAVGLAGQNP